MTHRRTEALRTFIATQPRWKLLVSIAVGLAALYLVTVLVVARAAYRSMTPSQLLRQSAELFPVPAARVDYSFVWMRDYFERYDYIDSFVRKTNLEDFSPEQTRDQVVEYLVEARLIQQLARQRDIRVTRDEIEAAYAEIGKQPGVEGIAEIERVLKELYAMTPTSFKRLIGEQLLRERVEQQVFVHIKARHILVSNEAEAKRLAEDIQKGTDFAELAKQYSQDATSRDTGGSLGAVGRGSTLPKPVEEAIFALPPESLPSITQSDVGYHVVDTEERVGVIDQNFADWLNQQKHERAITVYLPTALDWVKKD